MSRRPKILVTGGTGFIGQHLVSRLAATGGSVTVFDSMPERTDVIRKGASSNINFVRGDVRDYTSVESIVKGHDVVIHLAAITSIRESIDDPLMTHQVNATGTINALRACVQTRVRKFVFASSCAVYGNCPSLPLRENLPLRALSPYAASKISGEQYCLAFNESYDLETACLRLFNVYGLRKVKVRDTGVIDRFLERLETNKRPVVYGDGEQSRDFVHVDDAVKALIEIVYSDVDGGEVYNVGSGQATSVNKLVKLLLETTGKTELLPIFRPPIPGEVKQSQADITKLTRHFGFRPQVTLEDGLRQLVDKSTFPRVIEGLAEVPSWC